ncbi:dienelactone hydrolase family protein [Tepidiforma sp.]|uniref:dienelactone hydrolase family protein n=1 Tax=Tepidiforma sp. TaxID=2682230 RepID=UPI002ADE1632|nr:dienelactone hydrolase family protein [Tepidiforma sp.]
MPGNMWDDLDEPEDLDLRILRVAAAPLDDALTAIRIRLETTRGPIDGILHPVEGGTAAVVAVGGAMGGVDGPADRLYERLPGLLAPGRVTVLRLDYRQPNVFEECVLDVLAGCSFLRGIGADELALVGHSFGGAVVIKAAGLQPAVRGVVAMSPQLYGTQDVDTLGRPLLLIHGMSDAVLSHEASEDIYRRAAEPKRIALFAEAGHSLIQAKDRIDALLADWLPAALAGTPGPGGREEHDIP